MSPDHKQRLTAARGVVRASKREWPWFARLLDLIAPGLGALFMLLGP